MFLTNPQLRKSYASSGCSVCGNPRCGTVHKSPHDKSSGETTSAWRQNEEIFQAKCAEAVGTLLQKPPSETEKEEHQNILSNFGAKQKSAIGALGSLVASKGNLIKTCQFSI